MVFSLLENPFAVLGLCSDASVAQISASARKLGGESASEAMRALILPRDRLDAELSFLPGVRGDCVHAVLSALRNGKIPPLSHLGALARTNSLAHLAASGSATATQLKELATIAPTVGEDELVALNQGRKTAAMPPVPLPMFEKALEHLATIHAESLAEGARTSEDGPEVLSEIVDTIGPSDDRKAVFLRQVISSWDRSLVADANQDLERAHELEAKLRLDPRGTTVAELSALIRRVARRTRPARDLARHFGLPHEATANMVDGWRVLAGDLIKDHAALRPAEALLDSLGMEFGTSDEPGRRVARDLVECRERIASGKDLPEIRRFVAALDAAKREFTVFTPSILASQALDGTGRFFGPAVVVELWNSFVAAVPKARSDWPWRALRELAVELNNEHSAPEAALELTRAALRLMGANPVTKEVRALFNADERFLQKEALQKKLTDAIARKKRALMRNLLSQLIPLEKDEAERSAYIKLLRKLRWQAAKGYATLLFYGSIAGFIIYGSVTGNSQSSHSSAPSYRAYASQQPRSTPQTAAANDDDTEVRPPPGTNTLSRPELRWCEFQDARLNADRAYLESIRTNPRVQGTLFNHAIDLFNARISYYNASCAQFRYYQNDKRVVDAQLAAQSATLQAEGKQLGVADYLSGQ